MIYSPYNIILEKGPHTSWLFNSSSGVICEIENEVLSLYTAGDGVDATAPYYNESIELEILIPRLEEGLSFEPSRKWLTLVISLSEACNLSCYYCFQRDIKKTPFQENSLFQRLLLLVTEYVKTYSTAQGLNVVWFGGEPLLWKTIIADYSYRLVDLCTKLGIGYKASLITNGTLLDPEFIRSLKSFRIAKVQITVDGNKDKFVEYKKGDDRLWSQFHANLPELIKVCDVTLRVNLDKQNIDAVKEYLRDLADNDILDHINIHIARIETDNNKHCLSLEEFYSLKHSLIVFLLKDLHYSRTESLFKDLRSIDIACRLQAPGALVIDSHGGCHKCDEHLGTHSAVSISDPTDVVFSEINKNCLVMLPECRTCPIFPLCRGECPEHWRKEDCQYKINYITSLALMKARTICDQEASDE